MTPSGLPATSYTRLKPAMPRQPQPARAALHFGGAGTDTAAATTDNKDTLEKTTPKTDEELRKEEEARIRKSAEDRINRRYTPRDIEKLDKRKPPKRKTVIENAVKAQTRLILQPGGAYVPLIKLRADFINANQLTGSTQANTEAAIQRVREKEGEHYKVYQHIYDELMKLKPADDIRPHYIQKLTLSILEEALKHPKDKKEELIQEEIKLIKSENEPSFFAKPVVWARDSISDGFQNSYFYMKDKYIDAVGGAAYLAKRGATVGQDLASWTGTAYLSHQAINASGLSFPWSVLPAMAVGYIAPALGNRQKNSLAAGAALHGLANATGNMSVYGIPVQKVGHVVAGSGLVPNAVYSGMWNTSKTVGGHLGTTAAYTASLASWPLLKAANIVAWPFSKVGSLFSRSPKPEPVAKAEASTIEDTLEDDEETVAMDESAIQPKSSKTEEKKPATSGSWFSFWPASKKPAETVTASAPVSTLEEDEATILAEDEIAAEESPKPETPPAKSRWSFLGLGGGRKPKTDTDTATHKVEPETAKSETEATIAEPILPAAEETAPVIPKAIEKQEALESPKPEITPPPVPVVKPKPVKQIADTVEVTKVVPAEPKKIAKPPEKKPQAAPKTTLERYTWPAVHVVGGTGLIATGALLHLPIITAPIGMGMMAAGSAWTLYGVYKGFQAAKE